MEWLVIVPVDIRPVAETREELPQDAAPSTELMSFTVVAPTRQAAVDRVGSALRKLVRLD